MIHICQNWIKTIWVLIWIDFVFVLLALYYVGINHQKGGDWKGKGGLGPCKTSTALRWEGNLLQVHLYDLIAFVLLFEDFGEAIGFKGPRLILFWCLMPKGEKIKAKAINGSATTWEILKIGRIELLVCQNSFIVSLVKSWLLVGRSVDYGKKGSFWDLESISLGITLFMS